MQHVLFGTGAPALAPEFIGQHYIDETPGAEAHYLANGVAAPTDWQQVGAGGGGLASIAMAHFASGGGTKQLTEAARFWNLVVFGADTATIALPTTPPPAGTAYKFIIFITNEDGAAGIANVNFATVGPYPLAQIRASDAAFGAAGVPIPDAQAMRIDVELGEISAGGAAYYLDIAHTILPANIIPE